MGAASAASVASRTMVQECGGSPTKAAGTVKVILVTLTDSYDTLGSTLSLATPFPNRVFWAFPMTAIAKDASTGFTQIGLVPGTVKTDGLGGFSSTADRSHFGVPCRTGQGDFFRRSVSSNSCADLHRSN